MSAYRITSFPTEVVELIMQYIIDSYEPEGVRGVSITLTDIQNIAQTNRQFFAAQQRAYNRFAMRLPRIVDYEGTTESFTEKQFPFMTQLRRTFELEELPLTRKASGKQFKVIKRD